MILQPKEKLKKIRKSMFTQEVFSELVAMDQSQYNRREKGRITITDDEWERFAKVLNVDVDKIKEADIPLINITHNHGENDNSINGYEIKVNVPKNIFDIFHAKLDTLISLMSKT
ncbi:helix-turn-helix transcriptional regulator [Flavobacterium sp.]|uniref:helix-turn-helix domain-containing protein n=1 Tax=Flavobacterium sp. TaxID=239 RepID=UPI00286BF505|nr:helix-turn-helix transcriptional regulator [Flavobacterium sp.]